jgi:hypothetical protein
MMKVDRPALLKRSVQIAAGRPLIFKLHPNENVERATRRSSPSPRRRWSSPAATPRRWWPTATC